MESKFTLLTPNLNRSSFGLNYVKIAILTDFGAYIIKICKNYIINLKLIFFQGNLVKKNSRNVVFKNGEFWGKIAKNEIFDFLLEKWIKNAQRIFLD